MIFKIDKITYCSKVVSKKVTILGNSALKASFCWNLKGQGWITVGRKEKKKVKIGWGKRNVMKGRKKGGKKGTDYLCNIKMFNLRGAKMLPNRTVKYDIL